MGTQNLLPRSEWSFIKTRTAPVESVGVKIL